MLEGSKVALRPLFETSIKIQEPDSEIAESGSGPGTQLRCYLPGRELVEVVEPVVLVDGDVVDVVEPVVVVLGAVVVVVGLPHTWTQNSLCFVSPPIEPSALIVSLTWKPC